MSREEKTLAAISGKNRTLGLHNSEQNRGK